MSSKHTLGDAPIEAEYRDKMMHLAGALDYMFNGDGKGGVKKDRKVGFVVLVFPFGDEAASRCNFISNSADRRDIVTLFHEMIARFEGQPEASGHV